MIESKVQKLYTQLLKDGEFIKAKILYFIYRNHRGKDNAIKRERLLSFCQAYEAEISDREMRRLYSELPVIADESGIYWPLTKDEVEDYKLYLRKKALPLFARWNRVAKFHPKLTSKHFQQMEFEWGGKL